MRRPSGLLVGGLLIVMALAGGCGRSKAGLTELQRVAGGSVDVVLLSPHDALRHGTDRFVLEFRSKAGSGLVDVGTVVVTASMPMPGSPMFGKIDVQRTEVPGRYDANGQFDMADTLRLRVQWLGSAGAGSVTFSGSVQ